MLLFQGVLLIVLGLLLIGSGAAPPQWVGVAVAFVGCLLLMAWYDACLDVVDGDQR